MDLRARLKDEGLTGGSLNQEATPTRNPRAARAALPVLRNNSALDASILLIAASMKAVVAPESEKNSENNIYKY